MADIYWKSPSFQLLQRHMHQWRLWYYVPDNYRNYSSSYGVDVF